VTGKTRSSTPTTPTAPTAPAAPAIPPEPTAPAPVAPEPAPAEPVAAEPAPVEPTPEPPRCAFGAYGHDAPATHLLPVGMASNAEPLPLCAQHAPRFLGAAVPLGEL
jgi:hypothetical protein